MLLNPQKKGLFVVGTDTEVGKTVVAAAIAWHLRESGRRVGVLKPVATGCVHRREGLVSEDAELLAHAAQTPHPLDVVCPVRFAEPLAPSTAASRLGKGAAFDLDGVRRSAQMIAATSDVMIVEGAGGVMTPLDERLTSIDLIAMFGLPVVVVARPGLGTINHTLLTLDALRAAKVNIAGVVINRYRADGATVAEETGWREIERHGKVAVLCLVPDEPFTRPNLPAGILAALGTVDWVGRM